jgi:CubicO group peptidase (beta-lactamase class C family)
MLFVSISCTHYREDVKTKATEIVIPDIDITEELAEDQLKKYNSLFTGNLADKIDSVVSRTNKYNGFKGSVLVACKGVEVYSNSFGHGNYSKKDGISTESIFQLASVSKQFTSVSIMMLKEWGFLDYDDKVVKYIPELPFPNITIRQLMTHTSGLPNYMYLLEHHWNVDVKGYPTNEDMIALFAKYQTPPYFSPGRRYDYSNTGYAVLASVVERASGLLFPDFVDKFIFTPLGMTNSFVYSNALGREYPERTSGHYRRYRRFYVIEETVHDGVYGDKGVYSTVGDLLRWDQALYGNDLVSQETLKEAFTKVKVRKRREYPYGFGFRLKEVDKKKVVYHTGLWEGARTNLMRYVEDRNTIIVLNHTNYKANNVLIKKLEKLLDDPIDNTYTQDIINIAFKRGNYQALQHFNKHKKIDDDYKVDLKKMLEVADYLSTVNKPLLSNQVLSLYESFIHTFPNDNGDLI